jgi:prepilin-type N-terminal cleavage/methylation domain-containing protein
MAVKNNKGFPLKVRGCEAFSLIEVLVVISLFAIIAVITAQSLIRIIGNTSNSNSSTRARENLEYALSVMDRSIKNAKEVNVNANSCAASNRRVEYITRENITESFECTTLGGRTSIEQNGEALISNEVNLSRCRMTCITPVGQTVPTAVEIELEGTDAEGAYEATPVRLQTTILLRSY